MISTVMDEMPAPDGDALPADERGILRWLARRRVHLTSIVFLLLIIRCIVHGLNPHDLTDIRDPASVIGLGFIFCGLALRSWAAGILQKSTRLTTRGPYALIRNPLYAGSFMLIVGCCTIIADPVNWLLLLPFILLIANTVKDEERRLADKFGHPWNDYVRDTPRFIPRRVTRAIAGGWTFRQWMGSREYQAVGAVALGLSALQAWQYM